MFYYVGPHLRGGFHIFGLVFFSPFSVQQKDSFMKTHFIVSGGRYVGCQHRTHSKKGAQQLYYDTIVVQKRWKIEFSEV